MIRRFLPLIVLSVGVIIGMILVRDFVRAVLVEPLLWAGWFFSLLIQSVPQLAFWAVFVLLALIWLGRSLVGPSRPALPGRVRPTAAQGMVAGWAHLLERAETREFYRWRLAQNLGKLLWSLHFPDTRFSRSAFHARLESGDLQLPPEIIAFFEAGLSPIPPQTRRWFGLRDSGTVEALKLPPDRVLRFMEEEMGLRNADGVQPAG